MSETVNSGRTAAVPHIPYVPALDGVRAASILLVILTHTAPLGPKAWQLNSTFGPMGMSLFFCLSGYLIVSIIDRDPNVPRFLTRRILRIVPALVAYLAFLVLFFDLDWRNAAYRLLFIQNYTFPQGPALSHLWSLCVEMHFYLAMALATLILGRRAVWLVIPAAIVITLIRIEAGAHIRVATHLRVDEILSGGILALLTIHKGNAIRRALDRPGLGWAALVVTAALWALSSHPAGGDFNYGRPYFAAALVGVLIHARFAVLTNLLESRPAAYIARTSYALYIWHPLMILGWMNAGSDWVRYLVKRPVSYALTLVAAHVSTFWWEARWQAFAKRMTTPKIPHAADDASTTGSRP